MLSFLYEECKEKIVMQQRSGKYMVKKVAGESYRVYLPAKLPPKPPIRLEEVSGLLEKSTAALAKLNAFSKSTPNMTLFLIMYLRKEALLSSQIEGTQSSFSDLILFEHQQKPEVSIDDVEEVSNYVKAINYGLKRLRSGFPLCLRLLCEIHGVLLSGTRGAYSSPGEVRNSQNWIGGTRPGNALFVPPPVEYLADCLSNLEKFLHDKTLPVLIKAGLAHVQFETIHPFLDGNGRLGRLLIILLLVEGGLLDEPILYISVYLKQHRTQYYDLLQEVRTQGTWETWLEFFLTGVLVASKKAIKAAQAIEKIFADDSAKIATLGRARFSCQSALDYLKQLPKISVPFLAKQLDVSLPTARSALNHLVKLGIVIEASGKQRNKIYIYQKYLDQLEEGAKPF